MEWIQRNHVLQVSRKKIDEHLLDGGGRRGHPYRATNEVHDGGGHVRGYMRGGQNTGWLMVPEFFWIEMRTPPHKCNRGAHFGVADDHAEEVA